MSNSSFFLKQNQIGVFAYNRANLNDPATFLGTISRGAMQGITKPLGDRTPQYAPSLTQRAVAEIVSFTDSAPELPEMTLIEYTNTDGRNWLLEQADRGCDLDILILAGKCGDPSDITAWNWILLAEQVRMTNLEFAEFQVLEGELPIVQITGTMKPVTLSNVYPVNLARPVGSDAIVLAETIDGFILNDPSCGECKPFIDRCSEWFAVTRENSGSPGLGPQVVYSVRGASANTGDINSLATAPSAAKAMGRYIVVWSETDEAHHTSLIEDWTTIAQGTFTQRATGYVAGNGPRAAWVKSASAAFVTAANGYIYKMTTATGAVTVLEDGSLTSEDGNSIHGNGQTIISAHNNNVLLKSTDNGNSFETVTGPTVGANLTAVWVFDDFNYLVSDSTGVLSQTRDGGDTWETNFSDSSITYIDDISFSPLSRDVGYMAARTATQGIIYRTITGARDWFLDRPAIAQEDTPAENYNFVDACGYNTVLAGGIDTGADGIVTYGNGDYA